VLTAAIDGNQPQMIASGAEYMLGALAAAPQGLPALDVNLVHKTTEVLTAISAYSVTFSQLPATDTEEGRKALLAARKQVIDDLISATTVRAGREENWVLSLGVPVGFTTGWQWAHGTTPEGESLPLNASAGTGFMPPQLGLGLGVALQRLPKKSENVAAGFHLGLTALDLGLFAAYDSTGRASPPQWDTVLSPGIQLGLILGDPEHTFLIALDARYAPGILAAQMTDGSSTRGAFRTGITLAYYVPLFDFN